jgi:hypothetical protein
MSEVRIIDGKIVASISGFVTGIQDGYYRLIPAEESRLAKMEKLEYEDPKDMLRRLGPPEDDPNP